MKQVETILNDIAQENGFDNWEQYFECFRTTEPGRRVINKGIRKAINEALRQPVVSGSLRSSEHEIKTKEMRYIDYINRGFERCDLNDTVQYEETGYKGYYLIKRVAEKVTIQVWDSGLDKPNIYIEIKDGESIVLPLTGEMVMNWFENEEGVKRYKLNNKY